MKTHSNYTYVTWIYTKMPELGMWAIIEKPLEICIRDTGAGIDYHFLVWVEISERLGSADNGREGKETVKKLIVKKMKKVSHKSGSK